MNEPIGTLAALGEILRRNQPSYQQAEDRLREVMKPARLAPLLEPLSSRQREEKPKWQ